MKNFKESVYELIAQTATNLPSDVRKVMLEHFEKETKGTSASLALNIIAENIDLAAKNRGPICQDTGMPIFCIQVPVGINQIQMKRDIVEGIKRATKAGELRPNSVDSLTGKNPGDNTGLGVPVTHFRQWERDYIEVNLLLKGGGCENKSIQYSLPVELPNLGRADRDLDGIRKCILHSVYQAQGQGCSAGFIGVMIGTDRAMGYEYAKRQLFRPLYDTNPIPELAKLEEYIMEEANKLEIGPMGFGGKVTLLGCKIGVNHRLPASFFVTVSYNCWAYRRLGIIVDPSDGSIIKWKFREHDEIKQMVKGEGMKLTGKEIRLTVPIKEEEIRNLKVGDVVLLNGEIHMGRDAFHKYIMTNDLPFDISGSVLYHCGPVALKDESGEWKIKAAGPTTSIREEPYQADVIKKLKIRAVMGKGGMGEKTLKALKEHGAVYLNAIGGAAQYYTHCIEKVTGVDFLEFGIPEAMWHVTVKDLPAIVTMDASGNSLHKEIDEKSAAILSTKKERVY